MLSSPQKNAAVMTRSTTATKALLLASSLVVLSSLSRTINAFAVDQLIGNPRVSHSGPTNSLFGHEQLVETARDKRAAVFGANSNAGWNNGFNNNGWNGLLWASEPPNEYLKLWLISEHNAYRKMVPATDMRMQYWSEELAASAQRHANTCDFRHSRSRINIGENIWAAPYANYSDAVSRWFNEVNNPLCACNNAYKHCCGHYIQLVWAQTNLVGCGYARCKDVLGVLGMGMRAVLVCHYNPQGNKIPAFKWASNTNKRCSECPPDAPACHEGLCYMPLNYNNNKYKNRQTGSQVNITATGVSHNNNHKAVTNFDSKGGDRKSSQKALDDNTIFI